MKRKIIQIGESANPEGWGLSALCSDGTVWTFTRSGWQKLPDVPQDIEDIPSKEDVDTTCNALPTAEEIDAMLGGNQI